MNTKVTCNRPQLNARNIIYKHSLSALSLKGSYTDHKDGRRRKFFEQKHRISNESSSSNAYKQNKLKIYVKLGLLRLLHRIRFMYVFYAKELLLYLHKPVGSQGDLRVNKIISVILNSMGRILNSVSKLANCGIEFLGT